MEKSLFFKFDNKLLKGAEGLAFYEKSKTALNRVTFIK